MNLVYDYEILFNEDIISNINFYQVEKDDAFSTDFSHILYLNNNQYRIVSISSDKSFENLQSNQNIYFQIEDVMTFFVKLNTNKIYYKFHKYLYLLLVLKLDTFDFYLNMLQNLLSNKKIYQETAYEFVRNHLLKLSYHLYINY